MKYPNANEDQFHPPKAVYFNVERCMKLHGLDQIGPVPCIRTSRSVEEIKYGQITHLSSFLICRTYCSPKILMTIKLIRTEGKDQAVHTRNRSSDLKLLNKDAASMT